MRTKNLFIHSGINSQQFSVNLQDQKPDRIVECADYGNWRQASGFPMLEGQIEQLGKAILINFPDLF
jgi:hypothetical protein